MISRLVPGVEGGPEFRAALRSMTRESNDRLLSLVERFAEAFEAGDPFHPDPDEVRAYCESGLARLVHLRNEFVASNIYLLREATAEDGATHPVMAPQVH
jgi:hypothetical protein